MRCIPGHGIVGFEYETILVGSTAYRPGRAGAGPPVLLLHGFPQTHYCWRLVAPELTAHHTIVVCDLKGYGESASAPGGQLGEGYSKREMASELVELMARLGLDRVLQSSATTGVVASPTAWRSIIPAS